MTLLNEATESKKYDVRMIERNISRGVVSADEVEKNAKKLPDDADGGDWVNIETLAGDDSSG